MTKHLSTTILITIALFTLFLVSLSLLNQSRVKMFDNHQPAFTDNHPTTKQQLANLEKNALPPYTNTNFFFPPYTSNRARMGFNKNSAHDTTVLNAGWYMDWGAIPNPNEPNGVVYARTIYFNLQGVGFCQAASELSQVTANYTGTALIQNVQANPGSLWLIGNEGDSYYNGSPLHPQLYARLYHYFYNTIKATDPTAKVALGAIIQPSPLRMEYLDNILAQYQYLYSHPLPADLWNIHLYHLKEAPCGSGWGVSVPPASSSNSGWNISFTPSAILNLSAIENSLKDFRQWMFVNGYGDKPLIISEYGVLPPPSYPGFSNAVAAQFLTDSFNMLLTATDPITGYALDSNRLVQMWAWYSTNDSPRYGGDLFQSSTNNLTVIGQAFVAQTSSFTVNGFSLANLQKSNGGFSTKYVVTNTGNIGTTSLHHFYTGTITHSNTSPFYTHTQVITPNSHHIFHLANISAIPNGYTGYTTITADQPITGTKVKLTATAQFSQATHSISENLPYLQIHVTLSEAITETVIINYTTQDGTAIANQDYIPLSGTLIFSPGVTLIPLTITLINDNLSEDDEILSVKLSNSQHAMLIIPTTTLITLVNDDPISLTLNNLEKNNGGNSSWYIVTNTSSVNALTTHNFYTEELRSKAIITANTAIVYSFTQIISPNQQNLFNLATITDLADGYTGFATIVSNYPITAMAFISPPPPSVQFSKAYYSTSESIGTAIITITLSHAVTYNTQITALTQNGTATASDDYLPYTKTLHFSPGQLTQSFSITIINDIWPELTETVTLSLTNPQQLYLGSQYQAILSIIDDDKEDNGGTLPLPISTTLIFDNLYKDSVGISSQYIITNSSAFTATVQHLFYTYGNSGTLFLPTLIYTETHLMPPETEQIYNLATINSLSDGYYGFATIQANQLITGSVFALPISVQFSASGYIVNENDGLALITVTLNHTPTQLSSINYTTGPGTAMPNVDYTPINGMLSFAPGQLQHSLAINIINDSLPEIDESLLLTLNTPQHLNLGTPSNAILSIVDDDTIGNPDLSINKQALITSTLPGETVTYLINFYNQNATAHNIHITDALPSGITYLSSVGNYSGQSITPTIAGQQVSWIFSEMGINQSGLITLSGYLSTTLLPNTLLTNTVVITAQNTDLNASNNTATAIIVVPEEGSEFSIKYYLSFIIK